MIRIKDNDPKLLSVDLSEEVIDHDQLRELCEAIENNKELGNIKWGNYKPIAEIEKKIKENIEKKIKENNKNYQYHAPDLVHGLLSMRVYGEENEVTTKGNPEFNDLNISESCLNNWKVHTKVTSDEGY